MLPKKERARIPKRRPAARPGSRPAAAAADAPGRLPRGLSEPRQEGSSADGHPAHLRKTAPEAPPSSGAPPARNIAAHRYFAFASQ